MKKIFICFFLAIFIYISSFTNIVNAHLVENADLNGYAKISSDEKNGIIQRGVMFYNTKTITSYYIYDKILVEYVCFSENYITSLKEGLTLSSNYINSIISEKVEVNLGLEYSEYTVGIKYNQENTVIEADNNIYTYYIKNHKSSDSIVEKNGVGTGLGIYKKYLRIKKEVYYARQTGPITNVYWVSSTKIEYIDICIDVTAIPISFAKTSGSSALLIEYEVDKNSIYFYNNDPYLTYVYSLNKNVKDIYEEYRCV